MNSITEPVIKSQRQPGVQRQNAPPRTAKAWLDALSSGDCDQDTYFRGVGDLMQEAPETGWELLGLVDQYYRLGRIKPQLYAVLKANLQGLMVGTGQDAEVSPPPQMQDDPSPSDDTPPRAIAAGDLLRGRYLIQEALGQGGMGSVYSAIDQFRLEGPQGDQKVALKILHTEVLKRPRLFTELRREFQHLQSLSHPNIVRVHEFDRDGDLAFFTMEYLGGALLSRVLSARDGAPLPRSFAAAIIRDVGSAVAYAHRRGIVHGDLNPSNIFVTDGGEIRVLDFGASHQLHSGSFVPESDGARQAAVATPAFASCQILEGETADTRDDIYALACISYLLLTGNHPFGTNTALRARTLRLIPKQPRQLTPRQWNALRAGLNFNRERRPADAQTWLESLDLRDAASRLPDLASLIEPRVRRPVGRRLTVTMAVVAAIVMLAACGWWVAEHWSGLAQAAATAGTTVKRAFEENVTDRITNQGGRTKNALPVITGPVTTPPPDAPLTGASGSAAAVAPHLPPRAAPAVPLAAPPPPPPAVAAGGTVDDSRASNTGPLAGPRNPGGAATATVTSSSATAPARAPKAATPANANVSGVVNGEPLRARIEFATENVEVGPDEPMARVIVRRSRTMRGEVTFSWWTESGTAKPGRDFVPVAREVGHIASGQNAVSLVVPILADPRRRDARSFYVVIDEPSENAMLGARSLAMVTLPIYP